MPAVFAVRHSRCTGDPLRSTAIPALDAYYEAADVPLNWGDVVQVHGSQGSGKRHLLYFLLATCLAHDGWNRPAIVLDVSGKFSLKRFRQILDHRLGHNAEEVARSMRTLQIFRPASTAQLLATVTQLSAKHTSDPPPGVVAIHAVDAYYWPDRFRTEQLRSTAPSPLRRLAAKIDDLRRALGPLVVISSWGLARNLGDGNRDPARVDLEALSPLPVTHLVVLAQKDQTTSKFNAIWQTPTRPDKAVFTMKIVQEGIAIA